MVCGGEQSGKAQDINTPIPTPSGWRKLGDIQVGDVVFADDGRPCNVTKAFPVMLGRPCCQITFDSGETFIVDADHQWATQSESERKNTNRYKRHGKEFFTHPSRLITRRKYSVRTTKELAEHIEVSKPKTPWGKHSMANYSMPCPLAVRYQEKDLPIPPYILGVWLGDGTTVNGSIACNPETDWEIPARISQLGFSVTKWKAPYSWNIVGLNTKLHQLGVRGNKHIPEQYLRASVAQRLELLRGLVDTDGYATSKGSEFYNKNERLIDDACELLSSLGIKYHKRSKRAKLYGKDCGMAFTLAFNTTFNVFHLTRKKKKQNRLPTGHTQNYYIRSITPCPSVPVKCLEVDSPSHLFLIGKTFIPTHNSRSAAMDAIPRMFGGKLFWLVAADYDRTSAEFGYLVDGFQKLGFEVRATKRVDPGNIRIPALDITILTKSAKDPRKLAKEAPDGIIGCEASQLAYEDYLRLLGRTAPHKAWMTLSGTMEGSLGYYPELFERGQIATEEFASFSLPTWSNFYLYPGGENDPEILRIKNSMSADWFSERFGGKPVPPKGRVFKEFANAIHVGTGGLFEFDKNLPVYIWVDPGYSAITESAYAVEVAQRYGDDIYIVDEIYERGLVTSEIIDVCKKQRWWDKRDKGTVDIAAKQHQAMPAVVEVWLKEGKFRLSSNRVEIMEGIELLKRFLKVNPVTNKPNFFINLKCRGIISELGGAPSPFSGQTCVYRWKESREGEIIGKTPEDKYNHGIKAVIYGLVDLMGYTPKKQHKRVHHIPGEK